MKPKVKKIGVVILVVLVAISVVISYFVMNSWVVRFDSEFDRFFGKDNWSVVDYEKSDSDMYEKTYSSRNLIESETIKGKFNDWYIESEDENGNKSLYRITDHAMHINHDEYNFFESEYLSAKQVFVMELMDITHQIIADEIFESIILSNLPKDIAEYVDVAMMYEGGNPEPEFYDKLWNESWFTAKDATAEKYLETELYDFYIYIQVKDYRIENLSDEQREVLTNSYEKIIDDMCERFEENASFEIYFGSDKRAKYINGIIQ